jgi:hypothetical protein
MPKATITYPSSIVNGKRRSNGGWHKGGKRAYRNAAKTIIACLQYYREPRLYHVVFAGGIHEAHVKARQALCQRLTRKKLEHEWFSARERSEEKGDHLHVYFLVDSSKVQAQSVFNNYDDCWLALDCMKRGLSKPWINVPQNREVHGNNHHASLPYLGPTSRPTPLGTSRLRDGLRWLTYIYKARDKHNDEWKGQGQIFAASRPGRSQRPKVTGEGEDGAAMKAVTTGDLILDELIAKTRQLYHSNATTPSMRTR